MFGILNDSYFFQNFIKVQEIAFEDNISIIRIADKETKKQRNKETKKQRNKETKKPKRSSF
ncbi:MAG: hypothetical protein WHV67_10255 [Thermoanaerobaculia bacterium]